MATQAGKKRKRVVSLEEMLNRAWCYYCDKDFDDVAVLVRHQRQKHFSCSRCPRHLSTAGGLRVHMQQVHKEDLLSVGNALPHRSEVSVEIYGMEGIPEDILNSHKQRVREEYYKMEAEYRAATGNPLPGTKVEEKPKRSVPDTNDAKKRLAEFRAKKAAEKAAANGTPGIAGTPGVANHPGVVPSIPVGTPAASFSPYAIPSAVSPANAGASPYTTPQPYPMAGSPAGQAPYQPPYQYSPPGMPQAYSAPIPGISQPSIPPPSTPYGALPAGMYGGHPNYQVSIPAPPTIPQLQPPSLPQRPVAQPPNLSKEEMARMHSLTSTPAHSAATTAPPGYNAAHTSPPGHNTANAALPGPAQVHITGDDVEELVRSTIGHDPFQNTSTPKATELAATKGPEHPTHDAAISDSPMVGAPAVDAASSRQQASGGAKKKAEKGGKKRTTKLVYNDDKVSFEERKAADPKYAHVS
ncbi:hypothetical protein K470DRAFT_271576 [Piedraia hortae CBS 480.64]|uniref:C2H2-type domain-containing protein n=1 Tax=Piedraia hortae CBS 480.64 TaxID=1314780 RepID=A0A6A7BXG3_9PEZI|nr:hypothetical protein K470DRAFT_271576 [Piedraia hortae CBS 480.64]